MQLLALLLCLSALPLQASATEQISPGPFSAFNHACVLIGLGDSLTQGTMDAADNSLNTKKAYLEKIHEAVSQVRDTGFEQPLLSLQGKRISPFILPTNLGIDGADVFSIEGLAYYKRSGADRSRLSLRYLCNGLVPRRLQDLYDLTLYPYNLLAGRPVSQLDSAAWLLDHLQSRDVSQAIFILWIGNNDSSSAALGFGSNNPTCYKTGVVKHDFLFFVFCFLSNRHNHHKISRQTHEGSKRW